MIVKNLYQKILLDPAEKHSQRKILIVSGFATASMADRHMEDLNKLNERTSIDLIVGMTPEQGMEKTQHLGLCKLAESNPYNINFSCRYVVNSRPVHAKVYCWLDADGTEKTAFCGSANYTMTGFGKRQIEVLNETNPHEARLFHKSLIFESIDCCDSDIENSVRLVETQHIHPPLQIPEVTLSLLVASSGNTHRSAGLNWGQRPGRDPNQAYIPIPSSHYNFFPEIGQQFTVLTDDGESFVFVRAQDSGKALQTTQNNSLLGLYIRNRLKVVSGDFVERRHLDAYGRTDISFMKIDDETFYMDFRPNFGPGEG